MGDGIVGQISKGPVHRKVDDYVNHKNSAGQFDNRAGFLANLTQAGTFRQYLQILQTDVGLTPAEVNYLAARWYDPASPKLLWSDLQPIYPLLRQGLIKALQEAGSTLLLDSYWMPVGAPSLLAVTIAKSPVQVTRTILTPPSHMPEQSPPRTVDVPMWAITPQEHPPVAVNHTTHDGVVKGVNGNVVTWQRRELTGPQPSTRTRSTRTRPKPSKRPRPKPSKRRRRR